MLKATLLLAFSHTSFCTGKRAPFAYQAQESKITYNAGFPKVDPVYNLETPQTPK